MRSSLVFFLLFFVLSARIADAEEAILYSSFTDGFWQIWSMAPDGKDKKQLTFSPFDKREPDWIPQEQKVIYGTHNGEIYLADLEEKQEKRILENFPNVSDPRYDPVHQQLLFVVMSHILPETAEIWASNIDDSRQTILTHDQQPKGQPSCSLDGKKIVYIKTDPKNSVSDLWIMNIDGSDNRQIFAANGKAASPSFTLDGKRIIFASNDRNNDYDIYEINMESAIKRALIENPGLDTSPRFSVDGEKIVFVSSRSGSQQILVSDKNGQNVKQLTADGEAVDPQWVDLSTKEQE